MRYAAPLLLLVCASAVAEDPKGFVRPVFRDDAPADVKKAIEAALPARLEAAMKLADSLPGLAADAAKAKKGNRPVDVRVTTEKLTRAQDRLKALNEDAVWLPIVEGLPKVGTVSKPLGFKTAVKEVLDKGAFVGEMRYQVRTAKGLDYKGTDVVWITPTDGFVDGVEVPYTGIIRVKGTRKLGAATLLEVEIVDPKKVLK